MTSTIEATIGKLREGETRERSFRDLARAFVAGVELKDRLWRFSTYRQCFLASEAIQWFVDNGYATNRKDAVRIGNLLLSHKIFEHVVKPQPFRDAFLFYRFRPDVHIYTGYGSMLVRFIKGVKLSTRWHRFWKYSECFSGREAVAWFLENGHAADLAEAVSLGKMLMAHRVYDEYRNRHIPFENADSVFFRFTSDAREFLERSKRCRMMRHSRSFASVNTYSRSVCSVSGGYYDSKLTSTRIDDDLDDKDEENGVERQENGDINGDEKERSKSSDASKRHRRVMSDHGIRPGTMGMKRTLSDSSIASKTTDNLKTSTGTSRSVAPTPRSTSKSGPRHDTFCQLTRVQCIRRAKFCCEMAHVALKQDADHRAALHLTRAQTWSNLAVASSTAANMDLPDASVHAVGSAYNTFPKKGGNTIARHDNVRLSPELRDLLARLAGLRERLKRTSVPRSQRRHPFVDEAMNAHVINRLYGGANGMLSESELDVLMRGSRLPGGAVASPWLRGDVKTDFAQGVANSNDSRCCFMDKYGTLKLSTQQMLRFGGWRRPSEFLEKGVVPQMVQLVSPLTIKQDVVGDCSFVSSLCVAAAYERRFNKPILTNCIFPQDAEGRPTYNPFGKYMFKFHFNGIPRKVIIDDLLPVDRRGSLLCACSTLRGELWVSLLEKVQLLLNPLSRRLVVDAHSLCYKSNHARTGVHEVTRRLSILGWQFWY